MHRESRTLKTLNRACMKARGPETCVQPLCRMHQGPKPTGMIQRGINIGYQPKDELAKRSVFKQLVCHVGVGQGSVALGLHLQLNRSQSGREPLERVKRHEDLCALVESHALATPWRGRRAVAAAALPRRYLLVCHGSISRHGGPQSAHCAPARWPQAAGPCP